MELHFYQQAGTVKKAIKSGNNGDRVQWIMDNG
jgi:hypothetical protein